MKRILVVTVLIVIGLVSIVACTQATPTPTQALPQEETTEEPPAETTIPKPTETAAETEETASPATETPTEEPTDAETEPTEEARDIEALIIDRCSECHSVDRTFNADKTEDGWASTIDRMVEYGATVNEEEKQLMIEWLVSRNQ
jgi:cytoskeletal protein RodZ